MKSRLSSVLGFIGAKFVSTVAVLATVGVIQSVHAYQITYTFTGIGSGTLGGEDFSACPYVITCTADSTQINLSNPLLPDVPVYASICINGVGTVALTGATYLDTERANQRIDFYVSGPSSSTYMFSDPNSAFLNYSLYSSLGPVALSPNFLYGNQFSTTDGTLSWSSVSSAVFLASVPDGSSTFALLGLGLTGVGLVVRRWAPKLN